MRIIYRTTDCKYQHKFCQILFGQIKRYCNNTESFLYRYYGGKGVKCLFNSSKDIESLYLRDKVYEMKDPWLARRKFNGDFSIDNCFFIEANKEIKKQFRQSLDKIVKEKTEQRNKRKEMMDVEKMSKIQQIKYYIKQILLLLFPRVRGCH